MQDYFMRLADYACESVRKDETLLISLSGEKSDFCRFNHNRIRQAGHVEEMVLTFKLIAGRRHSAFTFTATGIWQKDVEQMTEAIEQMRQLLLDLPEDPHLLYATVPHSSQEIDDSSLPDAQEMMRKIMDAGEGLDQVGILARGPIYRGFANSLGQRNWFERNTFNLDWSTYAHGDKAVKTQFAGFHWNQEELERHCRQNRLYLEKLRSTPKNIQPGNYRTYLAPDALAQILDLLSYGSFGMKAVRTKQSPLQQFIEGRRQLSPYISMRQNTKDSLAPSFDTNGFIQPDNVKLVDKGHFKQTLISPRSAREFGVDPNSDEEVVHSLDMAAGHLDTSDLAKTIGTGLLVNNLWYLNYSDRNACRITGMTRFACFWVEDGEIQAPINVMRFDDTIYNILGEKLQGLSSSRELLISAETYDGRSTSSCRLPGILVNDLSFTL